MAHADEHAASVVDVAAVDAAFARAHDAFLVAFDLLGRDEIEEAAVLLDAAQDAVNAFAAAGGGADAARVATLTTAWRRCGDQATAARARLEARSREANHTSRAHRAYGR